jgi:hypothetical protein
VAARAARIARRSLKVAAPSVPVYVHCMRTLVSSSILVCALVAPAVADPQFVTLERVDRQSRLGLQGSLQFYDDTAVDLIGLRTEIYGQFAGRLRGGGTLGGYAHLPLGFMFVEGADDDSAVGNLELGGYYVSRLGARSDLAFHLGLTLPTASDDPGFAALTAVERNYDWIDIVPDTTALNAGVTLRAPLGAGAFLQGDFALDLPIDSPYDNSPIFHANLGIGAYVSRLALMGELATAFGDDDDVGFLGSLALGIRFPGAAHPHIAYIYVFTDDEPVDINAHILSFGFYASF